MLGKKRRRLQREQLKCMIRLSNGRRLSESDEEIIAGNIELSHFYFSTLLTGTLAEIDLTWNYSLPQLIGIYTINVIEDRILVFEKLLLKSKEHSMIINYIEYFNL